MVEIERTFLAKELPEGLEKCKHKDIYDIYFPKDGDHPNLRIRKNGEKYEITRKSRIDGADGSILSEETIMISEEEFYALRKAEGKSVRKIRYYYIYKGRDKENSDDFARERIAEIDIFQDALKGLVMVDFEFTSEKEKDEFEMPDFCMVDVTQDTSFAGGILCDKSYKDIEEHLKKYKYKKIEMKKS